MCSGYTTLLSRTYNTNRRPVLCANHSNFTSWNDPKFFVSFRLLMSSPAGLISAWWRLSLSLCLSLPLCLSVSLSFCLPLCLSISDFLSLSFTLNVNLFLSLSLNLSFCLVLSFYTFLALEVKMWSYHIKMTMAIITTTKRTATTAITILSGELSERMFLRITNLTPRGIETPNFH